MAKPSPWIRTNISRSPRKWATDETRKNQSGRKVFHYTTWRQLRRLSEMGSRHPRLAFAIAWGYHSLRPLRRLVRYFSLTNTPKLLRKQKLASLLPREHGDPSHVLHPNAFFPFFHFLAIMAPLANKPYIFPIL